MSPSRLIPFGKGLLALLLLLTVAAASPAQDATGSAPLKVLCVGNSFAQNDVRFLPGLAKAGGKPLVVFVAYKGGCSLKEHADAYAAAEKDPASAAARIYTNTWFDGSGSESAMGANGPKGNYNLIDALTREKWDIVTIQQYSALSYKPETYEPYAAQVIAAIRKYAPQAEIVVFETWAYREDDPLFAKGDFTPEKMYQESRAAYAKLATAYGFRTIPVGEAFHTARALPRWTFVPDAAFDFAHPAEGTLPKETGGLNAGWKGSKNKATGTYEVHLDGHHANLDGQYLGAAVFYDTLFKADVTDVAFVPPGVAPDDAATLRRVAHEAAEARRQSEAAGLKSGASAPATR